MLSLLASLSTALGLYAQAALINDKKYRIQKGSAVFMPANAKKKD